jgi:hypothetical protein
MRTATRTAATALLILTVAWGWPVLVSAGAGYLGVAAPTLLAAWGAAWFGEDFGDVIGFGPDSLVRGFGLAMLLVMGLIAAASRWQWFA